MIINFTKEQALTNRMWFSVVSTLIDNDTSNLVPRGPFCHALEIGTPGQIQRHSGFEWLCKHNRLRPEPIRFVRLDSGHAQSDGADFRCWTWPEVAITVF